MPSPRRSPRRSGGEPGSTTPNGGCGPPPSGSTPRRFTFTESVLADSSTQIVLEGLTRAVADPGGMPLFGTKAARGLFSSTASARRAALRCKEEGLLRVIRSESRGKAVQEVCALTDKGLAYLLAQVSPKKVLEDLVRVLEARQNETGELLMTARHMQAGLDALKATAEKVLQHVHKAGAGPAPPLAASAANGSETWTATILSYLTRWQSSGRPTLPW